MSPMPHINSMYSSLDDNLVVDSVSHIHNSTRSSQENTSYCWIWPNRSKQKMMRHVAVKPFSVSCNPMQLLEGNNVIFLHHFACNIVLASSTMLATSSSMSKKSLTVPRNQGKLPEEVGPLRPIFWYWYWWSRG